MRHKKWEFRLTEEDLQSIRCGVRNAIRRKLLTEAEREDAEQELVLRLQEATWQFKREKSRWETFRNILIRTKLRDLIRARMQPSAYEQRQAHFSIDDPIPTPDGEQGELTWKDAISRDGVFADGTERAEEVERLELILDVREAVALMPRHLKRLSVLLMHSDGCSKLELAQKLRINRRTLFIWRGELREYLSGYGFGPLI